MKIDKFLAHLKNLDIKICVHKNQIQYDAPKGVLTNEIHEAIRKRKYEIINFLNKGSTGTISKKQVITPAPHQDKYPLSFAQQRLWFLHKLEPENPFYNFPRALRLKGDLRVEVLRKAVRALLKRHTSLRTTFIVEEGTPYQVITKKTSIDIPLIDLSNISLGSLGSLLLIVSSATGCSRCIEALKEEEDFSHSLEKHYREK